MSAVQRLRWIAPFAVLFATGCVTLPLPDATSDRAPSAQRHSFSHEDWDQFLASHVDDEGQVAYAAAREDRAALDRYLLALAAQSPDSHPERFPREADRLAYWLNAYNAWVIHAVLAAYPVDSVLDIHRSLWFAWLPDGAGFFAFQRITTGGRRTTLYALENRLIRRRFDDPRIHFALNCASRGCPRLPREAFVGDRLEEQLRRETDRFLAEARNVDADAAAGVLRLSSIFRWYRGDFQPRGGPASKRGRDPLRGYLEEALSPAAAAELRACDDCSIEWIPYDWGLNDASAVPTTEENP